MSDSERSSDPEEESGEEEEEEEVEREHGAGYREQEDDDEEDEEDDDLDNIDHESLEREAKELREKVKAAHAQLGSSSLQTDVHLQNQFLDKYKRFIGPQPLRLQLKVPTEDRSILYKMALESEDAAENSWLVERLVNDHPHLLAEQDDMGRGALLVAVSRKKLWFIKAVLDSNISDSDLKPLLGPINDEDSQGNTSNCIQTALEKDLDAEVTIKLIEKASEWTLASQDAAGHTPLHHAVHYRNCAESRLGIVMALIECGDKAFDRTTGKPDYFSVFRYHVDSRRKYEKEKKKRAAAKDEKKTSLDKDKKKQNAGTPTVKKTPQPGIGDLPTGKLETTGITLDAPRPIKRQPTSVDGPFKPNSNEPKSYLANEARQQLKPDAKPKTGAKHDSKTGTSLTIPERPKLSLKKMGSSFTGAKAPPSKRIADKIAKELKLHYLRTTFQHRPQATTARNHDSAVKFLFGSNTEGKYFPK